MNIRKWFILFSIFSMQQGLPGALPALADTVQRAKNTSSATLKEQLEAMAASSKAKTPRENAQIMSNALEGLKKSKIIEQALKAGSLAPEFSLPNATGKLVSSKDLLARGPLVISFYRGGWCPYCNLELHALQKALPEIEAAGAALVAISPQVPDESLSTVEKDHLSFQVLSDAGNGAARKFGIVYQLPPELLTLYKKFGIDLKKVNGDESNELPLAATFVISKSGRITYAFLDADYKKRMEPADIVSALKKLKQDQ